jgi:hypothetical protein
MLERCALRNGNVHSADGWRDVLDPVIARYAKRDIKRFFRADAAYAIPAICARLEEAGQVCPSRWKMGSTGSDDADLQLDPHSSSPLRSDARRDARLNGRKMLDLRA